MAEEGGHATQGRRCSFCGMAAGHNACAFCMYMVVTAGNTAKPKSAETRTPITSLQPAGGPAWSAAPPHQATWVAPKPAQVPAARQLPPQGRSRTARTMLCAREVQTYPPWCQRSRSLLADGYRHTRAHLQPACDRNCGNAGNPWTEEEHRLFLQGLKKLGKVCSSIYYVLAPYHSTGFFQFMLLTLLITYHAEHSPLPCRAIGGASLGNLSPRVAPHRLRLMHKSTTSARQTPANGGVAPACLTWTLLLNRWGIRAISILCHCSQRRCRIPASLLPSSSFLMPHHIA